ncbi:pro-opiomelanocortin-like [Solea solea]|uniref:pro-opiomelanocortin-like n=1 Tax=Solea solea TaxID=90069 RepID=UPI002729CAC0|nr:pro-opiomelanocortin-like [Solea solea]
MVCLRWMLMVVTVYVCLPGCGSVCWNSSICNNLSTERRLLDCIHLCMPKVRAELQEQNALAVKTSEDVDDDYLVGIILATLASSEDKITDSGLQARGDDRRSYSMEHFRWGKPSGRKRRPVKIFASSLEGGGSGEDSFLPQIRRQVRSYVDAAKGGQQSQRSKVNSKSQVLLSPQDRKDGSYRMSHFRWGNPPASKRSDSFMKQLAAKPKGQLASLVRNIMLKDVQQRIPE